MKQSKYLTKKNHSPNISGKSTAPRQPVGVFPGAGLTNTGFESLNNTKARGTNIQPGKSHAKIMGASPKKGHLL